MGAEKRKEKEILRLTAQNDKGVAKGIFDSKLAEAVERDTKSPKEKKGIFAKPKRDSSPAVQNDGVKAVQNDSINIVRDSSATPQNDLERASDQTGARTAGVEDSGSVRAGRVGSLVRENYTREAEEFRTEENAEMFDMAYNQGLLGEKLDLGVIVPDKDVAAVSKAYVAGGKDGRIIAERRASFENRTPGLSTDAVTKQLSSKFGSRTLNGIDALGKKLGAEIRLIQRGKAGHERDSYYRPSEGVIAINVNEIHGKLTGDKLLRFIANHEGVHRIRETSPKAYAEMEKIALSKSKQTVENRMARFGESKERATEEFVADYFGEVLTSKAEIKTLLNEHRSIFDAIMEALEWLVDKMRGIADYSFSEIAEARKLFKEALAEADANVWGEEVRDGGEAIFSSGSKTIDLESVGKLRSIVGKHGGGRVNVNDFTSEDIKAAEDFAKKYFEEMGVKSPFFRAWFGDWRVGDNGYSETVLHTGELRGEYQNKDTGWKLIVSRKIHKETNHHGSDKVKSAKKYLPYIKEITENAILLDSFVSEDENNLSAMYHKLYAYSEAYGYPALLKLTVEELIDEKSGDAIRRDYILHNIEEESLSKRNRLSTPNHDEGNSSRITISELYALVKQFDKEFNPKPSSLVVNEDGTPMVVYHGTDSKFTAFDISKGRANMDIQGAFFSPWELDAKGYGENVGQYFLNIKKPASGEVAFAALNRFKGQNNAGVKAREYLIKQGYDGVNFYGEEYVAFYPAQIKSATDNIGTFNRYDADTLFSRSEDSEDNIKYFPPGEDPRRDIKVPSEVNGKKVRRFTRTAAESPALTPEMAEDVVSEIENGLSAEKWNRVSFCLCK